MDKHKEKKSVIKLTVIAVAFILIIVVGILSLRKPEYVYVLTPEQTLDISLTGDEEIIPEEVADIVMWEDSNYQIVDLRNPYEYLKGHIAGAINIPYQELLDDDNLKVFDPVDSITTIMYGKDQLMALGPYMILRQLGYDNLMVMLGGYDYYSTHSLDLYDIPELPEYRNEEPRYNYAEVIEQTAGSDFISPQSDQPELIIPTRKVKKSVVEGGC